MLYFRSSPPDMLYYPSRPSMLYNQSSSKTFTS
jgi:hypothetical protein